MQPGDIQSRLNEVESESRKYYRLFEEKSGKINTIQHNYFPLLDALNTSLQFIKQFSPEKMDQLSGISGNLESLQLIINASLQFQDFINNRSALIKQRLASIGAVKEFRKYEKLAYYYQDQIKRYREMVNQPDKLMAETLMQLQKLPAFREFFRKNSQLSQLFRLPGSSGTTNLVDLTGLQTVSGMQGLLQQRFGLSGAGLQQAMQSPSTNVQNLLSQWKDKIQLTSGQNSEQVIPSFVPNFQHKKSFWNRLQVGGNFQSVRGNAFLPPASDLGLSIAYLINERSSMGIGVSYKVGFRDSLNKFKVTNQGVGLRSFVDIKLKGSIYITGGGELNYRNEINNVDQLKSFSAWQKSGLLGLTKKVSINKKVKANLQLLWDFLSYHQVPQTSPIIFRFGYIFN